MLLQQWCATMKVEFYPIGKICDERLLFVATCAAYKGKWLFVRHRERNTWELPFVHIEEDNIQSMNLALKSGFKKYGRVFWVKLK